MAEKPIIFRSDMVRAILDGRKTQTRRVIRKPERLDGLMLDGEAPDWCPYGKVGDRLFVKEGYQITGYSESTRRLKGIYLAGKKKFPFRKVTKAEWDKWENRKNPFGISSGRFMYKSLARLWLEITAIRVERVQETTPEDCIFEGISPLFADDRKKQLCDVVEDFQILWDSINKKRGYGWDENPWAWCIEFRRIDNE